MRTRRGRGVVVVCRRREGQAGVQTRAAGAGMSAGQQDRTRKYPYPRDNRDLLTYARPKTLLCDATLSRTSLRQGYHFYSGTFTNLNACAMRIPTDRPINENLPHPLETQRDDLVANSTINQLEVLVQQIRSMVRLSRCYGGRPAYPLAVLAPENLEPFHFLVLARHLEVPVYSPPRSVKRTNDPAIRQE